MGGHPVQSPRSRSSHFWAGSRENIISFLMREVGEQAVPVQFLKHHRPMVFGPALTTFLGFSWYWPFGWLLPSFSLPDSSMPIGIWSRWSSDGGNRLPKSPIKRLWKRPSSYWLARKRSNSSIIPWLRAPWWLDFCIPSSSCQNWIMKRKSCNW